MITERAPAKVNLLLHVGGRRADGLHDLCSLFASIELADEVEIAASPVGRDRVLCPPVEGRNICLAALEAFRSAGGGALPPLEVRIAKRIPVAAGLGGGSADAAAVLRSANELAGQPLGRSAMCEVAAAVGADVPSQLRPGHSLVQGAGELVEPVSLPHMWLVLVPQDRGLAAADVYREADRIGATRARLDPRAVEALARRPLRELCGSLENDLQPAVLSLRPELAEPMAALRAAGATTALVSGSGPTVFGVFEDAGSAGRAARALPGAIATAPA